MFYSSKIFPMHSIILILMLCLYLHTFVYIGPSTPPQDVTTTVINSTSISVSWNPPPLPDQNGDIIGYQLIITNQNKNNFSGYVVNITNVTSYVAINLQEFEVYSFEIAAMTVIGLGPFSNAITNQTLEDSKYVYACAYYVATYTHLFMLKYDLILLWYVNS